MVSEMLTNHGIPGREKNGAGGCTDAEHLLRALGVSGKLAGFQPAAYMVERVLRTVIRCCWRQCDRVFLEEIAGTVLWAPPTNSEFLDLLASHLRGLDQCGGAGP